MVWQACLIDAGALALAAATLGVAHPPGFPLWVLPAHAAAQLPNWATAATSTLYRINLISAVAGAVTVRNLVFLSQ